MQERLRVGRRPQQSNAREQHEGENARSHLHHHRPLLPRRGAPRPPGRQVPEHSEVPRVHRHALFALQRAHDQGHVQPEAAGRHPALVEGRGRQEHLAPHLRGVLRGPHDPKNDTGVLEPLVAAHVDAGLVEKQLHYHPRHRHPQEAGGREGGQECGEHHDLMQQNPFRGRRGQAEGVRRLTPPVPLAPCCASSHSCRRIPGPRSHRRPPECG
mmetsp:Transcript_47751/g.139232  ORF Transcript_47751/g.139232 Transcript_47751/m.139232 type:complete len:213 (-) Transcript_47751:38-676(-)